METNNKPTTLYNSANLDDKDEYRFRKWGNVFKNIASESKYIDDSTWMMFELEGDGSPFEMKNNIDLSISISHIHIIAAFKVFVENEKHR